MLATAAERDCEGYMRLMAAGACTEERLRELFDAVQVLGATKACRVLRCTHPSRRPIDYDGCRAVTGLGVRVR